MTEISARSPASFSERRQDLTAASHAVRQSSIQDGGNFDMWRLSRLMQEAETDAQIYFAEQQHAAWLHEQLWSPDSVILRRPFRAD
jgi:hypothetical protein